MSFDSAQMLFLIAEFVGAIGGVYLISLLARATLLRKVEAPLKQYYSVFIAGPVSILLASFGLADGGQPQFNEAILRYGLATIILFALVWAYQKKTKVEGPSKKISKVVLAVAALAISVPVGFMAKMAVKEKLSQSPGGLLVSKDSVKKEIPRALERFQESLPMSVGNGVTIVAASLDGDTIVFESVYDLRVISIEREKLRAYQRNVNLISACTNVTIKYYLEKYINIRYDYADTNGEELFGNQITYKDCLPFKNQDAETFKDYWVSLIRQITPMTVDQETVLIGAKAEDEFVSVIYQLPRFTKDEVDVEVFIDWAKKEGYRFVCLGPDTKALLERGIDVRSVYVDKAMEKVFSFVVTDKICNGSA